MAVETHSSDFFVLQTADCAREQVAFDWVGKMLFWVFKTSLETGTGNLQWQLEKQKEKAESIFLC